MLKYPPKASRTVSPAMTQPLRIPVIDVAPLLAGARSVRAAVGRQLDVACREAGFFYISGHGVDARLISRAFAAAGRFFALPLDAKLALRGPHHYRGYHPLSTGIPSALLGDAGAAETPRDNREHFDIGVDGPGRDDDPFSGPNLWPPEQPELRATTEAYFAALIDLTMALCRGLAIGLGLGEHDLDGMFERPYALLTLIHYPPVEAGGGESGIAGHTDYGFLTALAQDGVGGLEVLNDGGAWQPVDPLPGTFVCNLGNLLTRLSGGAYRATRHRVVSPSGRDRYSLPFFLDPGPEAEIRCLTARRDPGVSPDYAPVTCRAYLLEVFRRKAGNLAAATRAGDGPGSPGPPKLQPESRNGLGQGS